MELVLRNPLFLLFLFGGCGLTMYILIFAYFIVRNHKDFQLRIPNLLAEQGIDDDIRDLGERRWTVTHVLTVVTFILVAIYVLSVGNFHKLTVNWGGVNVALIGAVASILIACLVAATEWFRDQDFRTPSWVYVITVLGVVLTLISGIYFAEPQNYRGEDYRQEETRGYIMTQSYYHSGYYAGGGGGGSSVQCSGKSCGYAVLAIILIIIILSIVILSATIPHFWVVGGMVLLTILIMMLIQDLRATSSQEYRD